MLRSGACRECGGGAAYVNALSCERTCLRCWQTLGCGDHGVDGASRSQLCSVNYAKNRYMITDTDVKKIPILKVEDASKAHGLLGTKMNVMLVPDAVRLATIRHGSIDHVEAKKAIKHAKAMEKHREKEKVYKAEKAEYDAKVKELTAPARDRYNAAYAAWEAKKAEDAVMAGAPPSYSMVLNVDTSHIPKPETKYPGSGPKLDSAWNFLARNQRSRQLGLVHTRYGLHKSAPPALLAKSGGKVYVCTESTDLEAVAAKFACYGEVKGLGENLFEIIHDAHPGATVVVDMRCDLRKMEKACPQGERLRTEQLLRLHRGRVAAGLCFDAERRHQARRHAWRRRLLQHGLRVDVFGHEHDPVGVVAVPHAASGGHRRPGDEQPEPGPSSVGRPLRH